MCSCVFSFMCCCVVFLFVIQMLCVSCSSVFVFVFLCRMFVLFVDVVCCFFLCFFFVVLLCVRFMCMMRVCLLIISRRFLFMCRLIVFAVFVMHVILRVCFRARFLFVMIILRMLLSASLCCCLSYHVYVCMFTSVIIMLFLVKYLVIPHSLLYYVFPPYDYYMCPSFPL